MKYGLLIFALSFIVPIDLYAQREDVNRLEVYWDSKFIDFSEYEIQYISEMDTLRPIIEDGGIMLPVDSLYHQVTFVISCRGRTIDFPKIRSTFLIGGKFIRIDINSETENSCVEVNHLYGESTIYVDQVKSDCSYHQSISLQGSNRTLIKKYIQLVPNYDWKHVPRGTQAEYEN